jgi:hypothetical protein
VVSEVAGGVNVEDGVATGRVAVGMAAAVCVAISLRSGVAVAPGLGVKGTQADM